MSKVFLIDLSMCNGCYNCQLACKDEYVFNDWMPYSRPQPEQGQFWLKVDQKTCGSIPKLMVDYTPLLCNHCDKPACMDAARDGAVYKRDDGFVIIDPEKATGQRQIVDACPYGVIYWNDELNIPQKCTGCAHLLDNGYELPRCVEACPTRAITFGEKEDLAEDLEGAVRLKPEHGTWPNVYYRNMPGQFIAGLVYDPDEKEVIIGAKCRLVTGAKVYETFTDDMGDFWFKDLPIGKYDLYIEAEGYERSIFNDLRTKECINLGDIAMKKCPQK